MNSHCSVDYFAHWAEREIHRLSMHNWTPVAIIGGPNKTGYGKKRSALRETLLTKRAML
jgi:hypothetical protein